jgi:hypothetical protein
LADAPPRAIIAASSMRRATLLLLLLALPGLLLPAGAWLHVCRCALPMTATASACCAPADEPAAAEPSCCASRGPAQPLPRAGDDDCRCEWLALPDLGDDPATTPDAPLEPAPPATTPAPALALARDAVPPLQRRWSPRLQRPPPPPFASRNLPLRI